MNLKNRWMPALLFCGVVALSSCDRNEQESVNPEFEQGMISHILADSAKVTSYSFSGKQLGQVNHFDEKSGEVESYDRFERDGSGKILKTIAYAAGGQRVLSEQQHSYNSHGLLTKTDLLYFNGDKVEYSAYATYSYDEQNHLQKKSMFEVEGDKKDATLKSYTVYEVLPNGNYVSEKQYVVDDKGQTSLFSTTTYSYDNNQNPFHQLAEPGVASSPNNMVASTAVVHSSSKTYQYQYAYTYDERGYPLTQSVVSPSGKRQAYSFLYSN
ncbi:hypothetical protein ACXYMU_15610 [Pontibacter sp. CAU 1760]